MFNDIVLCLQAFKKLSRGLSSLADISESFKSKTVLGLLRSAPDLLANIKNIESMYEKPAGEKGKIARFGPFRLDPSIRLVDPNELVPRKGKDEAYDDIMATIESLESEFEEELENFQEKLG